MVIIFWSREEKVEEERVVFGTCKTNWMSRKLGRENVVLQLRLSSGGTERFDIHTRDVERVFP